MKRPMNLRLAVGIGVTTLCLYALLLVAFFVLPAINPGIQRYGYWRESVFIPAYAIVGLLITTRRPDHLVGWLYALAALAGAIQDMAGQYATTSFTSTSLQLPGGEWAAWVAQLSQFVTLSTLLFLLLLFPSGRILSRRWRPVAWALIAGITAQVISRAFYVGQLEDYSISNPAGLPVLASVLAVTNAVGGPLLIFGFFGTVAMLVVRAYKSRGVERQQIKWFVFTALVIISLFLGGGALSILLATVLPEVLLIPLMAVINTIWLWGPASLAFVTALAILRYRLYDIDLIIRRTLVYTVLTATLGLVYFGLVILLEGMLRSLVGSSGQVATVVSTLAIAALFTPLRRRVQEIIDRRFYRRKYNAEQALAGFAAAVRDQTDLEALTAQVVGIVQDTMQPEAVSLWLRSDEKTQAGVPSRW
ncbi:MAG: hypothetical protein JSV61_04860 [Anaerolineales bacterium]|nr:MAG: hypothetical protein JSV61_04860 [Anaerolineales bacterium]